MDRKVPTAVALVFACACCLAQKYVGSPDRIVSPETFENDKQINVVGDAWNAWLQFRVHRQFGTSSVPEIREWQRVKSEFRKLQKQIDREYDASH